MRVQRDYKAAARRLSHWFQARYKPVAVVTCAVFDDEVYKQIKNEIQTTKPKRWYIATPVNNGFFKSDFNVATPKEKLSKIMKERYTQMQKSGQQLQLCIYISQVIDHVSYEEQEKMFTESIEWMQKELGITPTEFIPGWNAYNQDTRRICKKYGLKLIEEKEYNLTHDYFILVKRIQTD